MANSVFVGPFGFVNNGTQIVFPLPGAFPDGVVGSPSITFANETNSGWYRAGAGDVRFSLGGVDFLQFNATSISNIKTSGTFNVPSGGSFGAGSSFFITSTGLSGQIKLQNDAANAGIGLDLTTDATVKFRTRAFSAYSTIDCLGLKASGAAGANFGPSAVASITIVNGIVTACS